MRILVVEDEKNMNRLICEAMKDEGYSPDSCYDGIEALDYALAAEYDVIIHGEEPRSSAVTRDDREQPVEFRL